jgi:DNA topoisomerase-3
LEATPIVALTATATPVVQDDICKQLRLRKPQRFIHGFRRDNLAVHVIESNPSQRVEQIVASLLESGRLPAIVYAPTRKKAEELARLLGERFKAAAYHAGMPAPARDQVQQAFLEERIELIVATIAFGMGIDKRNVRTVIHAALPASVEGYYQEIGRAGRDGLPSEALLLHSFSDRKTHEFFFERDYPEISVLEKIWKAVPAEGTVPRAWLQDKLSSVDGEIFEKALEKLWIHGGLQIDPEENVGRAVGAGANAWTRAYQDQRSHRIRQLEAMQAFTTGPGCRMIQLVRHFGDPADSGTPCGLCDRCNPGASTRLLDEIERQVATLIIASLAGKNGQAVGRLFDEAVSFDSRVQRSGFERLLTALVRAGLIDVNQDEFERDGERISFRRVLLTTSGLSARSGAVAAVEIDGPGICEALPSRASQRKKKPLLRKTSAVSSAAPGRGSANHLGNDPSAPSEMPKLFEELRSWRLEVARKKGVPAFRILSDRVLFALCEAMPRSEEELLQVSGIGPKIVSQYGSALLSKIQS